MMDKLKKMYLKSAQLCDDYVDSLEYEKWGMVKLGYYC
jgi:hypothetical protein